MEPYRALLRHVDRVAPKLIEPDYVAGMYWLTKSQPIRLLEDWDPKGHGRDTLFRSLCEHLFSKYRTPAFLWSVCFVDSDTAHTLFPVVAHVAKGGSLHLAVQAGDFPVPLTKNLCHELLQTPGDVGILEAIRQVQVRAAGGSKRMLQAIMGTPIGHEVMSREDEVFHGTVIDWFGRQGAMFDPSRIGPLLDYIEFRRRENAAFSMKGRVPAALIRDMDTWHGELAKVKKLKGSVFALSGFRPGTYDQSRRLANGNYEHQVWNIHEILTSKDLAAEGRDLKHCVLSYASQVENGKISIWSMTFAGALDSGRVLTIEVHNPDRRIVQARGKLNRMPTSKEMAILRMWAAENNLTVQLSSW